MASPHRNATVFLRSKSASESEIRQQFHGVAVRLDLFHALLHHALRVDHIGAAHHAHDGLPGALFLLPDPVGLDGQAFRVGEQGEGEGVLFCEALMGGDGVRADADDLDPGFPEACPGVSRKARAVTIAICIFLTR